MPSEARPIILLYDPEIDLGEWKVASGESVTDWLFSNFEDDDEAWNSAKNAIVDAILDGEIKLAAADGWDVVDTTDIADLEMVRRRHPGVTTNHELYNSPEWKGGTFSWQDQVQSTLDVDAVLRSAGLVLPRSTDA